MNRAGVAILAASGLSACNLATLSQSRPSETQTSMPASERFVGPDGLPMRTAPSAPVDAETLAPPPGPLPQTPPTPPAPPNSPPRLPAPAPTVVSAEPTQPATPAEPAEPAAPPEPDLRGQPITTGQPAEDRNAP